MGMQRCWTRQQWLCILMAAITSEFSSYDLPALTAGKLERVTLQSQLLFQNLKECSLGSSNRTNTDEDGDQ